MRPFAVRSVDLYCIRISGVNKRDGHFIRDADDQKKNAIEILLL